VQGKTSGGGALAFSKSSDTTLAWAVYTMEPFNQMPMAVVCSGSITNAEDVRALYGYASSGTRWQRSYAGR
jgi:hypothetical protein